MLKNLFKFDLKDYWRNIDKKILFGFLILFFLGVFFSFSSTSSLAGERLNKNYYFFFSKHLSFAILALLTMFVISAIETPLLKKLVIPIYIVLFLLLILVPIIGIEVKGAKRWLNFYIFRLQPIELLKPFFILVGEKKYKYIFVSQFFAFCICGSLIIISPVNFQIQSYIILKVVFFTLETVCLLLACKNIRNT